MSESWENEGVEKELYALPSNMQHIMVSEDKVLSQIVGTEILDIGCGIGRWGYVIKHEKPNTKVTGIEIHEPYVKEAIESGAYNMVFNKSFTDLSFIKDKSFDTVIAIEVIEHVSKKEGRKLLGEIERIAKYRAILTTPSGFYKLEPPQESEQHKCGWTKKELEQFNYNVSSYGFHWDGVVTDKNGQPKTINVNRDWLICVKDMKL